MTRSRKVLVIVVALAIAGVGVVVLVSKHEHRARRGGDPGGRLLTVLKSAGAAIPKDARVAYRHDTEPKWDSCDGQAGTAGWNDVVVEVHFRSSGTPSDVLASAGGVLARQGWKAGRVTQPDGAGLRSDWTKAASTSFSVTLSNNTPDRAWDLLARAAPLGQRVSGC